MDGTIQAPPSETVAKKFRFFECLQNFIRFEGYISCSVNCGLGTSCHCKWDYFTGLNTFYYEKSVMATIMRITLKAFSQEVDPSVGGSCLSRSHVAV
ncbi:hypothetical protein NC651_017405 [Populus alba x Populus x berolinensis]|nr:hypothetical protein NC651_017405 [Populus alba x Populus x berolinensis]